MADILSDVETGTSGLTERQTTTKRAYPFRQTAAKKLRKKSEATKVQNTSAAVKDTGPTNKGKYLDGAYERY